MGFRSHRNAKNSAFFSYQFRFVGRSYLFFLQFCEVDGFEEGLGPDVPRHGVRHAEPLGRALLQQQQQDLHQPSNSQSNVIFARDIFGEKQYLLLAGIIKYVSVCRMRLTCLASRERNRGK